MKNPRLPIFRIRGLQKGPHKESATPNRTMMANLDYRVPDELPDASAHHARKDQQKTSPAEFRLLGK